MRGYSAQTTMGSETRGRLLRAHFGRSSNTVGAEGYASSINDMLLPIRE